MGGQGCVWGQGLVHQPIGLQRCSVHQGVRDSVWGCAARGHVHLGGSASEPPPALCEEGPQGLGHLNAIQHAVCWGGGGHAQGALPQPAAAAATATAACCAVNLPAQQLRGCGVHGCLARGLLCKDGVGAVGQHLELMALLHAQLVARDEEDKQDGPHVNDSGHVEGEVVVAPQDGVLALWGLRPLVHALLDLLLCVPGVVGLAARGQRGLGGLAKALRVQPVLVVLAGGGKVRGNVASEGCAQQVHGVAAGVHNAKQHASHAGVCQDARHGALHHKDGAVRCAKEDQAPVGLILCLAEGQSEVGASAGGSRQKQHGALVGQVVKQVAQGQAGHKAAH